MKITRITQENIEHFEEILGGYYELRRPEDFFLGIIDDDDKAIGVAALRDMEEVLLLRYLYVVYERRRMGYASALISFLREEFDDRQIVAVFYPSDPEDIQATLVFLAANEFKMKGSKNVRSLYTLGQVRQKGPFGPAKLQEYMVKGVAELLHDEFKQVLEVEKKNASILIDAKELLAEENLYGGFIFKDGELVSMLAVLPFNDGVRFSSAYVREHSEKMILPLLDRAINLLGNNGNVQSLYVDVVGEKAMALEEYVRTHFNLVPEETVHQLVAVMDREDEE